MKKECIDIIIIGAGLSGIGAAYHLQKNCPSKSLAILEGREALGGTWDLFKYPGIRSDSDMFTYGYKFKPWTGKNSLATGETLLNYLNEAAEENGIKQKIRFGHKVNKLSWSSDVALWTLEVEVDGEIRLFESSFVLSCSGYYDYNEGYQPEFNNKQAFEGQFIHPQHWPEDLDYCNKKIIVIGSGATAVTLVPNLAYKAKHVTMLQRSPTYIAPLPMQDRLLSLLRMIMPDVWVSRFARQRNIFMTSLLYNFMTKFPLRARKFLDKKRNQILTADIDKKHFSPSYDPWDQRLCLVPDGDLFQALNNGKASIKTDHIDEFTKTGISLKSGEHLEADIIVSATGLNMKLLENMDISVDGQTLTPADKMFYRGILLEDVPNFGAVFGYTNASWTLKSELVSEYVCRIINHMDYIKRPICVPVNVHNTKQELFLNLSSGYVQRAQQGIPKQGAVQPWRLDQDYKKDKKRLKEVEMEDGILQFNKTVSVASDNSSLAGVNPKKARPTKVKSKKASPARVVSN